MIAKLLRIAAYLVAVVGMLCTAAALIARQLPVTNHTVLFIAAYSPYVMIGAAIAAVLLLLTRRWLTAAVAIALTAAAVAVEVPLFIGPTPPPNSIAIRVFTANVQIGQADPQAFIDIANRDADVVAVQELTPQLAETLNQSGIKAKFPYQTLEPGEYGHGVGIWSRYPITASSRIEGYRLTMVRADIAIPGAGRDTTLVNVHLPGPWPQAIDGCARRSNASPPPSATSESKPTADPSSSPATSTPPTTWHRSASYSPMGMPMPPNNPAPESPGPSRPTAAGRRASESIAS